jgi:hypothetical protein
MNNRAVGRLALTIAAFALTALTAKPLYACTNCPSSTSNMDGVAANALPTYPEPTAEEASEPVKLKKFTKSQTRAVRRTPPKPAATLAQRARAGQIAARKVKQDEEAAAKVRAKTDTTIATVLANANAAPLELDNKTSPRPATVAANDPAPPAEPQAAPSEQQTMELVTAEEFNELDRAAWQANQIPKLMKLQASDSRAELREDDSKWAQTSTIGKLFVAFGALLTLGSAIRMFVT